MATSYKIYAFDSSCNLFVSKDTGATWEVSTTPSATLGDDWTDMIMGVNDNDTNTIGAFDQEVNGTYNPPVFNGSSGGISLSNAFDLNIFVSPIVSYSSSPGAWIQANSGAMTAGAETMLICPISSFSTPVVYPRLTTNGGVTWTDVTGLPAGTLWTNAAFSQGASIMYISPTATSYIYRSINAGLTWTRVPVSSDLGLPLFGNRMRCSQNGEIVGIMQGGSFFSSSNGGAAWTETDFTYGSRADFGMTPTGSVLVASSTDDSSHLSDFNVSTNQGVTWTPKAPPSIGGSNKGIGAINIAPDGLGVVAVYNQNSSSPTIPADISVDGGNTWITSSMPFTEFATGTWVSAFIFPMAAPVPTPVPYPGNPQTPTNPQPPAPPQPNPSISMRYSNDGGHTWTNYRPKGLV